MDEINISDAGGISLFTLSNGTIDVVICNYGCIIISIHTPDKNGVKRNIVAGFNTPAAYENNPYYLGCTVGRFANRIAFGKFEIDGKEYQLECNDGLNHLHGGLSGFHKKIWRVEQNTDQLSFSYVSRHGEAGYPGTLKATAHFSITTDHKLLINYTATTDKPTIVNLTNHSYFNLTGFNAPTIYNHLLKINAEYFTVKNANNVPGGAIQSVEGTPYDFRASKALGKDIHLLETDMGYDINYVINKTASLATPAATLYETESGRLLNVFTNQPGMQLYTANWWDGSFIGPQDKWYTKHGAVALETQAFPNAPNHKNFPNTILRPGEVYQSETAYQFLSV